MVERLLQALSFAQTPVHTSLVTPEPLESPVHLLPQDFEVSPDLKCFCVEEASLALSLTRMPWESSLFSFSRWKHTEQIDQNLTVWNQNFHMA